MAETSSRRVVVGRVSGAHGVGGWLRIHSHTNPRQQILDYSPWMLKQGGEWISVEVNAARQAGRYIAVNLGICSDRDEASALRGAEIAVGREQLPEPGEDEYYWLDLLGARVVNRYDEDLGRVDRIMETGANDVLVLSGERERLVPFIPDQVVLEVDLAHGLIRVDWDPED